MSRVPAGCLLVRVLKDFDCLDQGAVLVMPEAIAQPLIGAGIVRLNYENSGVLLPGEGRTLGMIEPAVPPLGLVCWTRR